MIGAHVDDDVFKCAEPSIPPLPGPRYLDANTQRNGMHVCRFGGAMAGMDSARNLLVCEETAPPIFFEHVDRRTQDSYPMHVCSEGTVMTGIHVDRNLFTCGQ